MKFMLMLCISVFSLLSSAAHAVTFQQTPDNSTAAQAAAVRYYGFFSDSNKYVGNGSDYGPATRAMANVHFVNDGFTFENGAFVASPEWYRKVNDAAQVGNKSILMLQDVMFSSDVTPRTEAGDYLAALRDRLDSVKSNVVGIYLFDEPFWKHGGSIGRSVINERLAFAATLARSYFPGASVIVTEGSPVVLDGRVNDHPTFRFDVASNPIGFPAEVDWVGVNCYRYYLECSDAPNPNVWAKLRREPNQKMVFTMDGYYLRAGPSKNFDQFLQWNEALKQVAAGYPTIAFIPFLYQSTSEMFGIDASDDLKAYFSFVGSSVKNGTFNYGPITVGSPPPPPPPQCTVLAPTCEGRDSVRRDSCGVEIERWVNAPPPYCPAQCTVLEPTCEGRDYVRRDSCGAEIERWVNAPAPYCAAQCTVLEPTCEGVDWVRRDSCGAELGRWVNAPAPYCPCRVLEPTCEGTDWVRRDSCGAELGRWVNAPPPYCPAR